MDFEKYLFLVNNTIIAIEAENKSVAIKVFQKEFEQLFLMDWEIKRIYTEITIDGEYKRY